MAGSQTGWTYNINVDGINNGMAYNPACPAGAQAAVWGDAHQLFGVQVMVREAMGTVVQRQATGQQPGTRKRCSIGTG